MTVERQHLFPQRLDESGECGIFSETDPFSQSQRSKSKEHTDRLMINENFQKTEKNEEITS